MPAISSCAVLSRAFVPFAIKIALFTAALIAAGFTCAESIASEWQKNLRAKIDVSSRLSERNNQSFTRSDIGLDLHKVFGNGKRDIATLIFQPYYTHFSDRDEKLIWRITTLNYRVLANGRFNFKFGHIELPYGLEKNLDTNGTLRQLTFNDRNVKVDWGVGVNGESHRLDYELNITRGSGNDWRDRDNPFAITARLGTPANKNLVSGISLFSGNILRRGELIENRRIGFDIARYFPSIELLAEYSYGETNDERTSSLFSELLWKNLQETLNLYAQFRAGRTNLNRNVAQRSALTLGGSWYPQRNIQLEFQWRQPFEVSSKQSDDNIASLLIRATFP